MYSQDRISGTIEENIPTASHTEPEQAGALNTSANVSIRSGETTSFTEQREPQRIPDSNLNSVSSTTVTRASIDITRPLHSYHEQIGIEGPTNIIEPGESEGFLHEESPKASPTQEGEPETKSNQVLSAATWWSESLALGLAIGALIAIVVMMKEYHNKQQPEWKYKINLNTIIAILSTLMRACLVFVAEEVISQLKWMLFRRPRPLQHLAHFDTASRGPWGSILLLFRTRKLDSALLGCIVIVFSVGIGPFTQQAIETVPCDRPLKTTEATVRIARYMPDYNGVRFTPAHREPGIKTKVALVRGLADPNGASSEITPDCSTGNCVFPSYQGVTHSSIAICKRCVDISPLVKEVVNIDNSSFGGADGNLVPTPVENFVLPDGHNIGGGAIANPPKRIMDVYGNADVWKSQVVWLNSSAFDTFDESFDDILRASIVNVSVLAFTTKNPVDDCDPGTGRCLKHSFNTSNL